MLKTVSSILCDQLDISQGGPTNFRDCRKVAKIVPQGFTCPTPPTPLDIVFAEPPYIDDFPATAERDHFPYDNAITPYSFLMTPTRLADHSCLHDYFAAIDRDKSPRGSGIALRGFCGSHTFAYEIS